MSFAGDIQADVRALLPGLAEGKARTVVHLTDAWARAVGQRAKALDGRAMFVEVARQLGATIAYDGLVGLYPVVSIDDPEEVWGAAELTELAARAGVPLVQLRIKDLDDRLALDIAQRLRGSCTTRFVLNDRADLAVAVGADGVHVGRTDLPADAVRKVVGDTMIVGSSSHTEEQFVEVAGGSALSYCAIGPVYLSSTKQGHADVIGLDVVRAVARRSRIPVCAIGGISSPPQVAAVVEAGADLVAVISALSGAAQPAEVAVRLQLAVAMGLARRGGAA